MTIEITLDKALKALDEAVAEKGREYVYPEGQRINYTCQYLTPDGKGSCLVGSALLRLGVPVEVLPQHGDAGMGAEDLLDLLRERDVATYEPEVATLFVTAQMEQDSGVPWGLAASRGVDAVEENRRRRAIYV